jgi:hypothetical protein
MPIRGVGRAAKRCYSLPLADARELPDAMEHCSNRDATQNARRVKKTPCSRSISFTRINDRIVEPNADSADRSTFQSNVWVRSILRKYRLTEGKFA